MPRRTQPTNDLESLRLPELQQRFLEVVGEETRCPNRTFLIGLAEWGWQKHEQKLFHDHLHAGGMTQDPLHEPVRRLAFRSFTRRRRDFVSDETWYAAPITELRRRCNVDDSLHSRRQLPHPGWSHAVTLMRAWGEAPFTIRHRFIVNLLHRELGRLWSLADCGPLVALPPRLKQTLDLIFRGYSEKQIASALNVSVHTAHDFAKRLYRHIGVAGRGDLLIHPACRRLFFCPSLSPAYYTEHGAQAAGQFPRPDAPL